MPRNAHVAKASQYYAAHGINGWSELRDTHTDPTRSYLLNKKGKRLCRFVSDQVFGYNYGDGTFVWMGWYTRLERVKAIMDKTRKQAQDFSENVLRPLLLEGLKWRQIHHFSSGRVCALTIHNDNRNGWIYEDEGIPKPADNLSWSNHNTSDVYDTRNGMKIEHQVLGNLAQFPNWSQYEPIGNALRLSDTKWRRFHTAQRYFHRIISLKLEGIEKDYKANDIVEFFISGEKFRYKKLPRRERKDNEYWLQLPSCDPQTINVLDIIPKQDIY
jgi:hypothetical protein